MKPRAVCNIERLKGKFTLLEKGKKCRLELEVEVLDDTQPVAEFHGIYWVLPKEDDK